MILIIDNASSKHIGIMFVNGPRDQGSILG